MSHSQTDAIDSIESRTKRALTEAMTVLPNHGEASDSEDLFTVVGQHENGEYLVNLENGSCTCKDSQYNLDSQTDCKHVRRVRVCTGDMTIPNALGDIQIDNTFGAHVDATPVYATADGGIIDGETGNELSEDTSEDDIWTSPRPEIDPFGNYTGFDIVECTSCGIETILPLVDSCSHKDSCKHE
jgi:predicted nucleic acid-binding Zn finger protein